MAENEDGQEKKHEASDKKWRDAAERGQIVRSQDLSSVAVVLAAAAGMFFGIDYMTEPIRGLTITMLDVSMVEMLTIQGALSFLRQGLTVVLQAALVPLIMASIAAVVANLLQSQFQMATSALEPKWDRLNFVQGFQNTYVSWTPVVELGKGVGKLVLLGAIVYWAIQDRLDDLPALAWVHPSDLFSLFAELAWFLVLASTPMVLLIGIADYAYNRYKLGEQLMQTDQEVKDERKQSDGDPLFRGFRRQFARKLLAGGGLDAVRTADVVVTNPTHYAIALRYDREKDIAPVVVAKGVDHLAKKIREEALRSGVPRIEDRPLARALYAEVPLDYPIPEDLYAPVAKVLAVIARRRANRMNR